MLDVVRDFLSAMRLRLRMRVGGRVRVRVRDRVRVRVRVRVSDRVRFRVRVRVIDRVTFWVRVRMRVRPLVRVPCADVGLRVMSDVVRDFQSAIRVKVK